MTALVVPDVSTNPAGEPTMDDVPRLYKLLDNSKDPDWVALLELTSSIKDSGFVHPSTGFTPLHLACMAKSSHNSYARMGVVHSLLQSAAGIRCKQRGWTPLMYACRMTDLFQIETNLPVVKLLLDHCPEAMFDLGPDGFSALDVHIVSISHVMRRNSTFLEVNTMAARSVQGCTKLLKLLLERHTRYNPVPIKSFELLFSCNTLEIMTLVTREETRDFERRLALRRSSHRAPLTGSREHLQDSWTWHVLTELLRAEHGRQNRGVSPIPAFNALHVACRMEGMPVAFVMLCKNAYPAQLQTASPALMRLPLHSAASWRQRDCRGRKSMILSQLVRDYPSGKRGKDKKGQTPWKLAVSSGSTWESGIRCLEIPDPTKTTADV